MTFQSLCIEGDFDRSLNFLTGASAGEHIPVSEGTYHDTKNTEKKCATALQEPAKGIVFARIIISGGCALMVAGAWRP